VRNVGIEIVKDAQSASFEPHPAIANMDLKPIAVMLQLVRPYDDRTAGMDKGGGRV
jgi:hypothetical protein